MDGEPKREMYAMLPPQLYPKTFNVQPGETLAAIEAQLEQHKIAYPFIVKPEIGGQGILFRKIDRPEELLTYHTRMPVEYIVQEMVHYPMEVSVFHIRHPKETRGKITGFLHKVPLHVFGDGTHTLQELVAMHEKAKLRLGLASRHKERWQTIIPAGEKVVLSHAANHNQGAHFIDLSAEIDDRLLRVFDDISLRINDFFYGRYDILCNSVEELKEGKNFSILEYNGCGAEPNHFYDTGYTLREAYREILFHWNQLYRISKYNASRGIKPWSFLKGFTFRQQTLAYFKKLKAVDKTIP